ncbi:MAG: 30S ribosomal protein S8 [Candidatus Marinimicrobia bacterium]|nr:30S ribosomal protein S8 [Candidatus Neomarinimicrobiota bacterium]|tara:strand:+ start:2047 stop:2445 length:399 start_codon:yes stop_codon:yes gene_type:complete
MSQTDPIADFITCIRNAQAVKKPWVDVPSSNLKKRICFVLKEEHFIRDAMLIKDDKQDTIRVFLSYDNSNNPVINGITKISKPGCRTYVSSSEIPRVLNGMGISILTTSKGVISSKKAELFKVGGEILCQVW